MPAYYDLLSDFGVRDGRISVAPFWVIASVRFLNQVTFDRNDQKNGKKVGNRSVTDNRAFAAATKEMLVLGTEVQQMSISSSKGAHVTGLDALLLPTRDFRSEILPGDWVFAWIVNSRERAIDLAARIRRGDACNRFDDGLKFMGRCQSMDKLRTVDAGGRRVIRYALRAAGFTEFDSQIIYFPELETRDDFGEWFRKLGNILNDIIESRNADGHKDVGSLKIDLLLPRLLTTLLGKGLPRKDKNIAGSANKNDVELERRAGGEAYLVPDKAAALLGKGAASGMLKYADLLEVVTGVQHYRNDTTGSMQNSFAVLIPHLVGAGPHYRTGQPLQGNTMPTPPTFDYESVWSILGQYLNPGINEMYLTLRASPDQGRIVPTFIARQLPFTTQASSIGHKADFPRTQFLELPRWKIDPVLVFGERVGTNDAQRFNFCHVTGIAPDRDPLQEFILNRPIRDDLDILRSGLRPYSTTVNCSVLDSRIDSRRWTDHVADFTMQQQLTLGGSLRLQGIEAPICVGDNCEFEEVVYHIEGVNHSCFLDEKGKPRFITNLTITHGMSSEARIERSKKDISIAQYAVFTDEGSDASVVELPQG